MLGIRIFFSFYGGKWRAAPHYPAPQHNTIVEPFAGSAGYSLRYPERNVILVEKDPKIAATWRYLISVSEEEILLLPDVQRGQSVDDLEISASARLLVGWWLNAGANGPCKHPSAWFRRTRDQGKRGNFWGAHIRERIAGQLKRIRHWKIVEGSFEQAPDVKATWFVDPPYEKAGKHYRFGSSLLDFSRLGSWCMERKGQAIVCENVGASWLPFQPWRKIQARPKTKQATQSDEAIWTNNRDRP